MSPCQSGGVAPTSDIVLRGVAATRQCGKARMAALVIVSITSCSKTALKQKAIPHAAVPDSTNHFSLVNALGESEFDLACFIE
jgi:hypothetical protein